MGRQFQAWSTTRESSQIAAGLAITSGRMLLCGGEIQ